MLDREFSALQRSALRDYEGDPRLHRVWSRLEPELGMPRTRSGPTLVLAPAFGILLFVVGVLVGRNVLPPPRSEPELLAERPLSVERSASLGLPATEAPQRPAPPRPSARPRPALQRTVDPELPAATSAESQSEGAVQVASVPGSPPAPPEWRSLAELGDFAGARARLDRDGGFSIALMQASPEELLVLVDVARASGDREQALLALRRLLDRSPSAPEAPLAAWTLGNMLEQSGDGVGAAEAFALYRRLSPTGDFAEDAAARQVHAALAQGQTELAARLLDQYAKDFPNGRRLLEFREELGKLETENGDLGGTQPEPLIDDSVLPPEPVPN